MKRRFFLLSFLFISILTSAQINLNDSTINIVAHWEVGDKAVYEYRRQDMDIIGNDTLPSKEPTYIEQFSFEVIGSTLEEYTIKYTLLDYKHVALNDGVEKEVNMLWGPLPKGTTAIIRTNELGEFIEIGNWNIPKNENENVAKQIIVLKSEDSGNGLTVINDDPIEIEEDPLSKMSHITDLFDYYGSVLYKDSIHSWVDKMPSNWNDEFIDVDCAIYAFEDIDDKEIIHIIHSSIPDSEQLVEDYRAQYSQLDINPMFLDQLSTLSAEMTTHFMYHNASGWIGRYSNERKTTMVQKTTLSIWDIHILFEDETDFY